MILVGGVIPESEKKILEILENAGPHGVVQGDLPRILGLSKSWVSEILSSLEKRGVIVRIRGPGKTLIVKLSRYSDPHYGRTIVVGLVPSIEYLPLSLMIKRLKGRGYRVEFSLKRSVIDVATSFIRGELHIAYLPIYTLAVLRQLGIGFKILGAVALGGASIVSHSMPGSNITKIFASSLSTMEVLAIAYSRSHDTSVGYYRDPDEIVERISTRHEAAAILWEPYSLIAKAKGLRRTPLTEMLGDYHCCLLIARDDMRQEIVEEIMGIHIESIESIRRDREKAFQIFSKIIGLEPHIVERASKEYRYTYHIDRELLKNIAARVKGPLTNIEFLESLVSQYRINTSL